MVELRVLQILKLVTDEHGLIKSEMSIQRTSITVTPVTVTIAYSDRFFWSHKGISHTENHQIL